MFVEATRKAGDTAYLFTATSLVLTERLLNYCNVARAWREMRSLRCRIERTNDSHRSGVVYSGKQIDVRTHLTGEHILYAFFDRDLPQDACTYKNYDFFTHVSHIPFERGMRLRNIREASALWTRKGIRNGATYTSLTFKIKRSYSGERYWQMIHRRQIYDTRNNTLINIAPRELIFVIANPRGAVVATHLYLDYVTNSRRVTYANRARMI